VSRRVLPAGFYVRSPEAVARELLGKTLIRLVEGERLEGTIVETEAYHGLGDPASRAFHGMKSYNAMMWAEPGQVFVYNVHKYWMLNVIAHEAGGVGGVLFRAIEPTLGVDAMMRRRPVGKVEELTSGPGKLSLALGVTRDLSGVSVRDVGSPVHILDAPTLKCRTSHRIGVTRDLPEELRFYVQGNAFVSR
jgi:DNA-3-methyladenine glycosylase